MKKLTIILLPALILLFAVSCEKDNMAVDNTTALPNGSMLSTFVAGNVSNATQTFTVNAEDGGSVVGSKGTRVTILPGTLYHSLLPTPVPVTGDVTITLIEVYSRKDMVFMNKSTMGLLILPDTLSTLVSGGEYYLRVSQNGTDVLAPTGVAVHMPVENTGDGTPDPLMTQFDGTLVNGNMVWEEVEDGSVDIVEIPEDTTGEGFVTCYQILDGEWGWTNVDRFYDYPGPKTILKAQLPTGFTPANTEVFITYDGEPTALAALDIFEGGYFSEHYGLIPIGLEVHFIAVTYIDGQLHYAIQGATIEEDHIEEITSFYPTTQAELATLINNLP